MIYVLPAATFEAVAQFTTGLTGTLGVRIIDNAGATTTPRVTAGIAEYPAGSGIYAVTLTAPSSEGQYTVVWDASGTWKTNDLTVTASTVVASAAGSNYITSAALKKTLTLTGYTFADDDVDAAVTAASRTIDEVCDRRFYADANANQVRYYSPDRPLLLEIDDLVTLTSLASDDDGSYAYANVWTLNTDFIVEPLNAAADSEPWTHLRVHPSGSFTFNTAFPRSVKLTGKFGWAAVPGPIVNATTMLAARLLRLSREAPFGVVSFEGGAIHIARTDTTIMSLVGPYDRHRIAVG